jgi:hypothetical protein
MHESAMNASCESPGTVIHERWSISNQVCRIEVMKRGEPGRDIATNKRPRQQWRGRTLVRGDEPVSRA